MEKELPSLEELEAQRSVVEPVARQGSDLPLLLTLAALLIWFGFQTFQLIVERNSLSALQASFDSALQESQKMQGQLQALVTKTVELADQGNAAAKGALAELEKRGIPLKGAAPPPAK
jgi:hypothetical protein